MNEDPTANPAPATTLSAAEVRRRRAARRASIARRKVARAAVALPKQRARFESNSPIGSAEWHALLTRHLTHVLGGDPAEFVRATVAGELSKGAQESEAFTRVANVLKARGARKWLTAKDVRLVAVKNGWWTSTRSSGSRWGSGPYVRVVSGGPPTLGAQR